MVKEMVTVLPEKNSKKDLPTIEEFLAYYHSDIEKEFPNLSFQVKAKYEAWRDNGWRDGFNKKIENWRSKIKNAVSFMKPATKNFDQPQSEQPKNPRSRP